MPHINPHSFRPPPRITDVLPAQRPSQKVLGILEDMDIVSRLQIAALSAAELAQLKAYLVSFADALEAYARQTTDVYRAE